MSRKPLRSQARNIVYNLYNTIREDGGVNQSQSSILKRVVKLTGRKLNMESKQNMEEVDELINEPVQLSKGINLRDLLTSETEFQIDLDFKQKKAVDRQLENDELFQVWDDDEASDCDDVLKNIEDTTEKLMLSSPEYHSFSDLAAKMTDCVSSGDCKILIIEEGDGPLVPVDAEVEIHYAAYWEKEKIPFDSTLTMNFGARLKIRLGAGKVLPGLEIALSMVKGPAARLLLLLAPRLAWGARGVPPRIRPETALFVIALYGVKDRRAPDTFNDLPMADQKKYEVTVRTVYTLHSEAKELFKKKKHRPAMKHYQQSMMVLSVSQPNTDEEEAEVKRLKINTYVNLAMCYCKLNKPNYAISMLENLDYVTDADKHCKALYYFGQAYHSLGNNEKALEYYKKALKLEPKNQDIGRTLAELDAYLKKSAEQEKVLWRSAFGVAADKDSAVYDVDEDFKNDVKEMCRTLSEKNEYAKFDLPTGISKDEIACIRSIMSDFKGLTLLEDGEGSRKKVSVVRKLL